MIATTGFALVMVLAGILGLAQLVCFVLVLVRMFENGETGMGIACIVLSICTGIGGLIAFVYGWMKSSQWGLQKIMLVWTACLVLNLVLLVGAAAAGAFFTGGFEQMQQPNVQIEQGI